MPIVEEVLRSRLELAGVSQYSSGFQTAAAALGVYERALTTAEKRSLAFGTVAGVAAAAGVSGLVKAFNAAGRMQSIEVGFKTTLGSEEAAKAKIVELQQFAAATPFDFEQSAKGAQQLLAMGVAGNDLIPVMHGVGSAVAAAGGDTETFLRALRAVGQIQTKGRLQGDELLQLSEAGIPATKILQDELGLTADQVRNIGAQGLESGKVIAALTRGFDKRFGTALADQNKTLEGSYSNLGDSANRALGILGRPLANPVAQVERGVSNLIDVFNNAPPAVQGMATAVGVGAVIALGGYSLATLLALRNTGRLAAENIRLTNETLKAGGTADGQAGAEDLLAGALGRASGATEIMIGLTNQLAGAHVRAAEAAELQALANGGGGAGIPTGGAGAAARRGASQAVAAAEKTLADRTIQMSAKDLAAGHAAIDAERAVAAGAKTAGLAGKLAKGATIAGAVALATDIGLSFAPDEGAMGSVKRIGKGVAGGAATGLMLGALIPGFNATMIPEIAGGVIGGAVGGYQGYQEDQAWRKAHGMDVAPLAPKSTTPPTKDRNTELLEEIARLLGQAVSGDKNALPLDTGIVPMSRQIEAIAALRNARSIKG